MPVQNLSIINISLYIIFIQFIHTHTYICVCTYIHNMIRNNNILKLSKVTVQIIIHKAIFRKHNAQIIKLIQ